MPRSVPTGTGTPPEKVRAYFHARQQGASSVAASRVAGINRKTGDALWSRFQAEADQRAKVRGGAPTTASGRAAASRRGRELAEEAGLDPGRAISLATRASGRGGTHGNPAAGAAYAALIGDLAVEDPIPAHLLSEEARRATEDFAYFRRRYLGRGHSPWQEEAGTSVVSWLESPETEFVVLNAPPSAGKSTLFTHDVVCWLIARNRRVRVMLGSRTYGQAIKYSRRVRRTLVSMVPYHPTERARQEDGAVDALACLQDDFGRFRPAARGEAFQAGGFTVAQLPGEEVSDKEFTVTAFGFDTDYLGQRPDVAIWDDLVDLKNIRNQEQRDDIRELWDNIAEARVEPPGLILLQGQRLRHDDLYRHNIDKQAIRIDDDDPTLSEEMGPKYRHVIYPAHSEACCQGNHSRRAPALGEPGGCLLNPRRLHWGLLRTLETENPDVYRVVYQQEDLDPTSQMVPRHWVAGGLGPDGVMYRGCWDDTRSLWSLPPNLSPPYHVFASVDPSIANWWAVQVWLYHPASEQRFLLAIERRRMTAPEFLEQAPDGTYTGLLPEYQQRSVSLGIPIRHWVVEVNVAQKWLLQYRHATEWATRVGVNFVPHTTGIYKTDTEKGIPSVKPLWRTGRVRLPGNSFDGSRQAAELLVKEITRWPHSVTDDQTMAHWFVEWNLARLAPRRNDHKRPWRPTWITSPRKVGARA
jgi:hypothetical protein